MPDDFNKTMMSDIVAPISSTMRSVQPVAKLQGKKIERRTDITDERRDHRQHHQPFSDFTRPDPDMWNMLLEAVARFNDHQDIRRSPYVIRLWAQNNGFRVQIIQEDTGVLVKQTKLVPFKDVSNDDLNHLINALIGEEGVVIDLMR